MSAQSATPAEAEASTSCEDSTRDPLLSKIFEFTGSLENLFEHLESAIVLRSDRKKPSDTSFHQEGVDEVEKAFSPNQSPYKSQFKGIKFIANSRSSLKS